MLLTLVDTAGWAFGAFAQATVIAPSGANVVTFNANSQQQITLTESGAYTIRVNANNLVTTVNYNLGLECLRPRGPVDGTLTCGGIVSDAIGAAGAAGAATVFTRANPPPKLRWPPRSTCTFRHCSRAQFRTGHAGPAR